MSQTFPKGHGTNMNTNQFAWTGTKILLDALGPPAISSTIHNPRAKDKNHKASCCMYRQKDRPHQNHLTLFLSFDLLGQHWLYFVFFLMIHIPCIWHSLCINVMHSIVYMYLHGGYNLSVINTSILVVATEQHIIGVHTRDLHCSYLDWISSWTNYLSN